MHKQKRNICSSQHIYLHKSIKKYSPHTKTIKSNTIFQNNLSAAIF